LLFVSVQLTYELRESREFLSVNCEIFKVVHVGDVQEQSIERHLAVCVVAYNILNRLLVIPFVGCLHPAETPERGKLGSNTHHILILLNDIYG
jgi:hypothetical protein